MHDVTVIEDPAAAEASLDPIRAAPARRAGRARVRQHARGARRADPPEGELPPAGAGAPRARGARRGAPQGQLTERVLQATAASYVISPTALSAVAPDPSREPDQRSARWLLAVAGRLVREVGELITGASAAGKPLATLGIDSEVRFASAKERAAFAAELAERRQRPRRQVPRRGRPRRPPAPLRRRAAPHHHQEQGAPVMSREFEVIREVDLPAAPDDVWTAITAERRPGSSRPGRSPAGERAEGGRSRPGTRRTGS